MTSERIAIRGGASRPYDELVREDRVHGSIYTDPAIFEEEMERIFHRGWVFVGHEGELRERGDYRTFRLGRQPVVFVRGDDDVVRVLMNRCTHRGTLVCPHERGNGRVFTCAYHGWTFRNTGELAGVPHPEQYGKDFDAADLGLRPVPRTASYRGYVFASLSVDVPPLEEYLGPRVCAEIDLASDLSPAGDIDVVSGVHKFGYDGNWKLQLENSVDGYHITHLHRSYFRIQKERTGMDGMQIATGTSPALVRSVPNGHVIWDMSPVGYGTAAIDRMRNATDWARRYYDDLVAAHGEERAHHVLSHGSGHVAIFPNLVIIASQLRVIRPVSVDETEVFIYPTLLRDAPAEVNEERLRRHESFYGPAGGGATDDLEVFDRVMAGLHADVDPWILLSRGREQERIEDDGTRVAQITSELSNRAILGHWKQLMGSEGEG
jgi:phenylpropionate dioxygenase-like ring-hydroxylating dioxygenase large terminal subunit